MKEKVEQAANAMSKVAQKRSVPEPDEALEDPPPPPSSPKKSKTLLKEPKLKEPKLPDTGTGGVVPAPVTLKGIVEAPPTKEDETAPPNDRDLILIFREG